MAFASASLLVTRRRILAGAACLFIAAAAALAIQFWQAKDLILPTGGVIGGDFSAFYAAGHAAIDGDAAAPYDAASFEALLKTHAPYKDYYGLFWQYPPTYYFIAAPFASLGYLPGYALFVAATAAAFLAALRRAGFDKTVLIVAAASPAAFQTIATGQNGFLTAALLAAAAYGPDRRPVLAGLAAALLTLKPQLGLLVPLAYAAAGCWRAFTVAALGTVALGVASVFAFGPESWAAFVTGATRAASDTASGLLPLFKMATPFGAARFAGLPIAAASTFAALIALFAAAAVVIVWRRIDDAGLRAATLSGAALLAAPYGYYYDLAILLLPGAILVRRAMERGWLKGEQIALVLLYLLPLFFPGEPRGQGVSFGFLVVVALFACVLRRVMHERPDAFRFASARLRPQSG